MSDTYKKHEAREKEVMGAGYEAHESAERASDKARPRQSVGTPHKFPSKQLPGCFLAEHHRAVDISRTPDRFKGTTGTGNLRMSGVSGAHRIGKK